MLGTSEKIGETLEAHGVVAFCERRFPTQGFRTGAIFRERPPRDREHDARPILGLPPTSKSAVLPSGKSATGATAWSDD